MDKEHWITTKTVIIAHSRFLPRAANIPAWTRKQRLHFQQALAAARGGELCGAVTGAIMAEGLVFPFNDGQDTEAKDKIASIAKQCVNIAREKYGYVRCADLKGNIDCSEIIAFMAKTAEDIMKKEKN